MPGDVVLLAAGSLVPADAAVLEARDFFVTQAVLTAETFPVEKMPGIVDAQAGLNERVNCVFMGTSARSGTQDGAFEVEPLQFGLQGHQPRNFARGAQLACGYRVSDRSLTRCMLLDRTHRVIVAILW